MHLSTLSLSLFLSSWLSFFLSICIAYFWVSSAVGSFLNYMASHMSHQSFLGFWISVLYLIENVPIIMFFSRYFCSLAAVFNILSIQNSHIQSSNNVFFVSVSPAIMAFNSRNRLYMFCNRITWVRKTLLHMFAPLVLRWGCRCLVFRLMSVHNSLCINIQCWQIKVWIHEAFVLLSGNNSNSSSSFYPAYLLFVFETFFIICSLYVEVVFLIISQCPVLILNSLCLHRKNCSCTHINSLCGHVCKLSHSLPF